MKKFLILMALLFVASLCGAVGEIPALRGHVNDYASLLSPDAARQLEAELTEFERSDSTQIVVLTVPSLNGEVLEQYSIRVVEAWKIGQKGKDNGALLLVARDEHKIRIEAGRGLEGKLTDLTSGRIIRNEISPAFKRGDFDAGVAAGVRGIMAVVRGEYTAEPRDEIRHGRSGGNPIFTFLIFALVASVFLGGISKILGGIAGAIGIPLAAFLSFSGLSIIIIGLLAFAGFFAGLFLSFLFSSGGRGGFRGGGPFFGGFGGFGGGSFGGGGGGGFSGGGGSFGGGGASGDW